MAAQNRVTIEVGLAPPQAEAAVYDALVAAGVRAVRGGGGVLAGETAMGWRSWGERVTATTGYGPRGALVVLVSECLLPMQIVDWGKNRANVVAVLERLRALAPVL